MLQTGLTAWNLAATYHTDWAYHLLVSLNMDVVHVNGRAWLGCAPAAGVMPCQCPVSIGLAVLTYMPVARASQ